MSVKSLSLTLGALLVSVSALSQESWTGLRPPAPPPAPAGETAVFTFPKADPESAWPAPRTVPITTSVRAPETVRVPTVRAPVAIDETALRYYASQNDTARAAAEIRRIRLAHPGWNPPDDLFDGSQDTGEEQSLWKLFAEGNLDQIKDEIAAIQERQPTWRPSPDFAAKYEQALARRDLITASDAGDNATVLAIVETRQGMLVCAEMDVLWRVAEALAKTDAQDKAFDLYRFIMARCPDPQERLATVQKAALVLPLPMTEKLLAAGPRAGERASFETARLDIVRRRIGEAINGSVDLSMAELKSFETMVEQRRSAQDSMLLGWLRYARKDAAGAARWFKASMGYGSLPKAIEGYALSLREQGQFAEAEKVSYENRKSDPLIAQLYIEILATDLTRNTLPTIDPARLSQFEAVVEEIKSANGSQALGWYYFRSGATQTAYDWFKRSVAWEVLEANTLGLALAAHKLNDRAAFKSAVTQYGPQFAAVASLSRMEIAAPAQSGRPRSSKARSHPGSPLANEAVALFHSGKYAEALAVLDKRAAIAKEDEGLQLLRGWTLYHTGQWTKAKDHFAAMDARNSTRETQYGKFYSNERLIAPQFRAD